MKYGMGLLVMLVLMVAGCQGSSAKTADVDKGNVLGDTGIHVSGAVEAGGATRVR